MSRSLGDVLEALRAGVVVLDRAGAVEELNSVACRLLEHSHEAVRGRAVEALVEPQHALARIARKVLASGIAISELEQTIEQRGGERTVVDIAASPLFGEVGTAPDGAVLVLRDRSAERRLELLEAERERFEAFGRIAAGLAHEIKNPLGGIRGAGELLAARADDAKTREIAELVVRESARITRLVDELGVFARGDELRTTSVNVHRLLDGVLALLEHEPGVPCHVVRAYDPSIPELLADGDRLTQVFLNLARNARQALSPPGGTLTVTTRMTLDHRIALAEGRPLPTLAIWFEDSGRGMDADELRQATTPFFTTKSGGTGLGLAVAEYWVARHFGSLHLESEKGLGTRARLTLPLRRPA